MTCVIIFDDVVKYWNMDKICESWRLDGVKGMDESLWKWCKGHLYCNFKFWLCIHVGINHSIYRAWKFLFISALEKIKLIYFQFAHTTKIYWLILCVSRFTLGKPSCTSYNLKFYFDSKFILLQISSIHAHKSRPCITNYSWAITSTWLIKQWTSFQL